MIREDKSYLSDKDLLAIEKGFANLDIHSIRIKRESYTEEEKAKNLKIANSVSKEEWDKHCNEVQEKTASKVKILIESLSNNFTIYQYKDNSRIFYKSNWDLYFWCNNNSKGRDYSYVTLTLNKNRTLEERILNVKQVINSMKEICFDELDIIIQYTVKYDDEKVKEIANNYFKKVKNVFIQCMGMNGKIKEVGIDHDGNKCYGFFKKGARTKYYGISIKDMAIMSI